MPTTSETVPTDREATIELRAVEPGHAEQCARVLYEAFGAIHDHHRFERDFSTLLEAAEQLTSPFIAHPLIWASSPSATAASWGATSSTSVARSAGSDPSRSSLALRGRASGGA